MPNLQSWDVVVHGRPHRVELDRNPDTGKHLVRVDGRVALKPFGESRGEFRLEIDGKPFLLHVSEGSYRLEDKGSRYHDTTAARQGTNLGQVTICRGLEHIAVVTDEAILRIEKISEVLATAATTGAGGGLVGSIIAQASLHLAQKVADNLGERTIESPIRNLTALDSEVACRLEHLPLDLVALFSDEIDLGCRVLVVPRRAVRSATSPGKKILIETDRTHASGSKPHKFDTLHETQQAIDHLCAAGYPLAPDSLQRAGDAARSERERRRKAAAAAPPPAPSPEATTPPSLTARAPRAFSGLSEVRWTAPLVTTIGRDPSVLAEMEADAKAWAALYPKTVTRRVRVEEPLRNLGKERYDVVHLHGAFDEKTRFKEIGGFGISLKDLIARLVENRVKMLWLGSANDDRIAAETLQWVAGLNFFLVLTIARGADYSVVLEAALRRLSAGEALSAVLPEIERTSQSRWRLTGRGESIFLAR